MPERLHFLAKQILDERGDGWPGLTFRCEVQDEEELKQMYCPVLPTLLRAAFELPLRIVQFRRFDSGEGDLRRFNGRTLTWELNTSANAGYWAKRYVTGNKSERERGRGYAYEFADADPKITGFFVNSNKTGSPYHIPWMSLELHTILWELAEWQLKYNPVEGPITPAEYLDAAVSKSRERTLPDIFALFRALPTAKAPARGKPPSHQTIGRALNLLLVEVEKRWNESNPENKVSTIRRYNPRTNQPEAAVYSLHGLRVRGITNLHKAGLPFEILSKIVAGHATVAMTIYYLLFEPVDIHNKLDAAMLSITSEVVTSFVDDLKKMKIAEAKRKSTYIDGSAIEAALTTADPNTFCNVDIGICPHDGTRCGDGGEVLRTEESKKGAASKTVYGPVRGGPRNCIMCRHFFSGTPFILQMELFGSLLLWRRNALAQRQTDHRERLRELHGQKISGEITAHTYRAMSDRLRAENNDLKDQIEDVDNAIFRVKIHLESASKIIKEDLDRGEKPSIALVANDTASAVQYFERTPFEMATILTSASRMWSILGDDSLEQTKRQFIDQIMFNASEVPISLRADLTERQRQASTDILAEFLLRQLSRDDQQALTDGQTTLQELNVREQVKKLIDQVTVQEVPLLRVAAVKQIEPLER
jgi:hypothetical protein